MYPGRKRKHFISWIMFYQIITLVGFFWIVSCETAENENHHIIKRDIYMTFQDRAQAICIGFCMYQERRSYYRCQRKCKIGSESEKKKKDPIIVEHNQILKNNNEEGDYFSRAPK